MPALRQKHILIFLLALCILWSFYFIFRIHFKSSANYTLLDQVERNELLIKYQSILAKWKSKDLKTLHSSDPIEIHAFVFRNYFDFFYDPKATEKCSVPCKFKGFPDNYTPHWYLNWKIGDKPDAILAGISSTKNFLEITGQRKTGILYALIRNEPDAIEFSKACGDPNYNHFDTCPMDLTLSYQTSSSIWTSYNYLKPLSNFSPEQVLTPTVYSASCAFVSKCHDYRKNFILNLRKYTPLRNYGACERNVDVSGRVANKMEEIKKCKFNLALENTVQEEYATEKFFEHFQQVRNSNTVLVYKGSPKLSQQLLSKIPKLFIDANQFTSEQELGTYLNYLLQNDAALEEFFSWETNPQQVEFFTQFLETYYRGSTERSVCKLCYAVADMRFARNILQELGFYISDANTKLSLEGFQYRRDQLLQQIEINFAHEKNLLQEFATMLAELYDIGYARVWKQDNYLTEWNNPLIVEQ